LGAYLVIERSATAGAMFAASILLGRALQPIEQIVGSWRNLVSARGAFLRVRELLAASPVRETGLSLPRPQGRLTVEALSFVPQASSKPILRGVAFGVEPGEVLGVIGPSGAGKSTLARHIVGVLPASAGAVRLDGADVARSSLGRYIGYLPQDIELFSDSIAANISRFQVGQDRDIILAAQAAGVHEMILRLPDGYDTQVGEGGAILSGGYRQRIGLARAIYGNPSLVVLDEPSSNLDAEGDAALSDCIVQLKQQGTSVVIVSHRPSTLGVVDKILVLRDGVAEMFGPRAEIMARLTRPVAVAAVQSPAVAARK
jgi:ATP-binding cassette, subfamily C, bacterial